MEEMPARLRQTFETLKAAILNESEFGAAIRIHHAMDDLSHLGILTEPEAELDAGYVRLRDALLHLRRTPAARAEALRAIAALEGPLTRARPSDKSARLGLDW